MGTDASHSAVDDQTAGAAPRDRAARRFVIAAGLIGGAVALYLTVFAFVGYTDDAYLRSDLIRLAPEISGPISAVHVADNVHVEAGTPLVSIDPQPFLLAVAARKDRVAAAEAAVAVKRGVLTSQSATIQERQAALSLAEAEFGRLDQLSQGGYASQDALDRSREALQTARAALSLAKAQGVTAEREVEAAERDVASAGSDLAIAEYDRTRTVLRASAAGYINNLDLRAGRYASAGAPLIGLVDDGRWRVVANLKEDVAASVKPGTRVWIWLDTDPWRFHAGRVAGVARAIARDDAPDLLLPYIAPTTDWVRLRRRFPVTILLDPPLPRDRLFMGADARVVFWR